MRATKNLPQPEKPSPSLAEMRLEAQNNLLGSEIWMSGDFSNLVEFITQPNMDNAHTAASLAFGRIRGLTTAMTFQTHSGMTEADWDDLAGTIHLNACILRQAFDLVFNAKR
jgi:hypothetical protein